MNFVAESLDWPAEFAKWEDTDTVLVKPKSRSTLVIGPKAPHEFVRSPDHPSQWVCRCCGARAFTAKQASSMQWKACPGTRLKKAARPKAERPFAEQAGGERSVTEVEPFLGHAMFRYGTLHYCSKCGYYAEHRSVGLERPCTGKPAANYGLRLNLLAAGLHPKTKKELGQPRVKVSPEEAREWQRRAAEK